MASVAKRPNGSWRVRWKDPETGSERTKHFALKRDAERFRSTMAASIVEGAYTDPALGRQPVRDYFADWSARKMWTDGTRESYVYAFRKVTFGGMGLSSVRRSHVEAWIKSLEQQGYAPNTIRRHHSQMVAMFRSAIDDRIIAFNPAKGVTLPKVRRNEVDMTIPTGEQVDALTALMPLELQLHVAVSAFAGLRIGEACALQVGDVDFLRRILKVRRQVRPGGEIAPPKAGSERDIPIPDSLVRLIAAHVDAHGVPADGWLFPGRSGPVSSSHVRQLWNRANAELRVDFNPHDLRHYFASALIAAGLTVVTVQKALGHSDPNITLRVYSHLWPDAEDKTRAALEALMRGSDGPEADRAPVSPLVSGR